MRALLLMLLAASSLRCGGRDLVVPMQSQNNSGEDGATTFTQHGARLTVKISVTPSADQGPQAAHLHPGQCGELGGALSVLPGGGQAVALRPVVQGISETELSGVTIDQLTGGRYSINLHYSKDPTLYVSCGELP